MANNVLSAAWSRVRERLDRSLTSGSAADAHVETSETVIRPSRFHPEPAEAGPVPKPAAAPRKKLTKARYTKISALLLIALPTFLATLYYGFVATSQYASTFQFAVRSNERSPPDQLGMLAQLGSSPLHSESYIVVAYLKSQQFIEDISKRVEFRKIYSRPIIDWFSRLNPKAPREDLERYWEKHISVHFNAQSGIVTAEVRAFTPEDAQTVAKYALNLSSELVNKLSVLARDERVSTAEGDVKRMEIRVATAMAMIKKFRDRTGVIDPAKSAGAGLQIFGKFQEELARLKTQLAILTRTMQPTSLPVVNLKQRIKAMEDQIRKTRAQVGADGTSQLPELSSQLLGEYEGLELEKRFSEKAYVAAMQALEVARSEASRNQRYLSVFVQPHMPEYPNYPKRLLMIFAVLVFSAIGWGVVSLIYLTVKDHIL